MIRSSFTPADFILKILREGHPYDESVKKILILALEDISFEISISSEVTLFKLPDAKELLTHYLDAEGRYLCLTINGEITLLETKDYEDLLFFYIEKRALDDETQELMFKHPKAKKLVKMHHKHQGLAPSVERMAKDLGWI